MSQFYTQIVSVCQTFKTHSKSRTTILLANSLHDNIKEHSGLSCYQTGLRATCRVEECSSQYKPRGRSCHKSYELKRFACHQIKTIYLIRLSCNYRSW